MKSLRLTGMAIALALVLTASYAQAENDAGRESAVGSIGVGARALGMGGGYTSLVEDATAIHYNPAGLAHLTEQEFAFMHSFLFEGTIYDFASWVYPISEQHGVGGGVARIGTNDIIRRSDFADQGTFDYAYTQMMLSYGRRLASSMSFGLTMKIVHQNLDNRSDFGVGIDVGLSARVYRHLRLGVVAHDLARPELKLDQLKERLPTSVSGGLALRDLALSPFAKATASLELTKSDDREVMVQTGAEMTLHDVLSMRVGYHRDNLTLGAGVKVGRMQFDYAFKSVDWVSDIHEFSLSFGVGMTVAERKRQKELAALPPEPTPEEIKLRELLATANRFFHRFQLDSAKTYFQKALEYAPDSEEILGTLAAIEEARGIQEQQEAALKAAREDVTQTLTNFVAQAQQLFDQKMYDAALDLLNLIFDTDPTNEDANILRNEIIFARAAEVADCLQRAQRAVDSSRWFDAVELYNRVLELDPDNTKARESKQRVLAAMDLSERIRLGIEMFEKGDYAEARARFEAILEVNPNDPIALEYLRRISEPGTEEKPAPTLEDLQHDQEYWDYYLEGLRFMRNKEYQRAIDAWEKVLKKYPNNKNTLNNIEQARLRLGTQEAEQ